MISRELYYEMIALVCIAGIYLYVFLTDPNHKMPQIKAVNIAKEEEREEREKDKDKDKEQRDNDDRKNQGNQVK